MVQNEGERLRKERTFRERSTALDILTDRELIERYRFPRQGILSLTDLVTQDIQRSTARYHAIPPFLQGYVLYYLSITILGLSHLSSSRSLINVGTSDLDNNCGNDCQIYHGESRDSLINMTWKLSECTL
ncbi:Hypothetical predicted protein, partial [Mytilus galloprovincialis]